MRATSTVWHSRPKRRTFERPNTWVQALLHFEGRTQSIVVRNISRGGMRIEFAYGLTPGEEIKVELMSGRTLQGTVAWSVATYCGVEFPSPLAEGDPLLDSCKIH